MAVKQELLITIGPDGGVKIEVKGAPGGDCLDITKEIEEELGVVTDRQYTSEFYQQPQQQRQKLSLGSDDDKS